MKKDNNLIKVTFKGETRYFTKETYIIKWTGLQNLQIKRANLEPEYAKKYDFKMEIVDGSHIEYKDINVI